MPGDLQEEVSRLCDLLAGRRSDPPGLEGPGPLSASFFCNDGGVTNGIPIVIEMKEYMITVY